MTKFISYLRNLLGELIVFNENISKIITIARKQNDSINRQNDSINKLVEIMDEERKERRRINAVMDDFVAYNKGLAKEVMESQKEEKATEADFRY